MIKNKTRIIKLKTIAAARKIKKMLLEPVIGYTRIVFATKYFLSTIAAILILVLILFPAFNSVHDNFRITFSNLEGIISSDHPKMMNPRFQGVDDENQTYDITADYAEKQDGESLSLKNINANINMKNNSWISLIANKGIFDHTNRSVSFNDAVNIFTSSGYEFYTKEVEADLKERAASGQSKIHGHGPIGSITADRFKITDGGDSIIFKGNVKLIIHPDGLNK